jgi:hypothetical protein
MISFDSEYKSLAQILQDSKTKHRKTGCGLVSEDGEGF